MEVATEGECVRVLCPLLRLMLRPGTLSLGTACWVQEIAPRFGPPLLYGGLLCVPNLPLSKKQLMKALLR
jgi:hypothetical protein